MYFKKKWLNLKRVYKEIAENLIDACKIKLILVLLESKVL